MNPKRKLLVYIAAPYTYPDPVENTNRAIRVAEEILAVGFIPVIPHLTLAWHLVCPHPPEFWYEYDLQLMRACDVVLRLPGKSVGADNEVSAALRCDMPVFHSLDDLIQSCYLYCPASEVGA